MHPGPIRRPRSAPGSAVLVILGLLAGCGGGPAPLPAEETRAFFRAGGPVGTIEIVALDRLPLRAAELVAPDGQATPASAVVARPEAGESSPVALPTGGVAALGNIGATSPAAAPVGAAVGSQQRLLATVSSASISLPDPVAYRRHWRDYRIRLRFAGPPAAESREIAAPEPPPEATPPG
jgi:hypothetical protein